MTNLVEFARKSYHVVFIWQTFDWLALRMLGNATSCLVPQIEDRQIEGWCRKGRSTAGQSSHRYIVLDWQCGPRY